MLPFRYRAKIVRLRQLTGSVRELTIRLLDPPQFTFTLGQAIGIGASSDPVGRAKLRYYSIASAPGTVREFVLLIASAEPRDAAHHPFQWKEGEEVYFTDPQGGFPFPDDPHRALLLIAAGTGIAPFQSMLYALQDQCPDRSVTLLWGLRSEQELYYQDELKAFSRRLRNFSYVVTLSRAQRSWSGPKGRVTHLLDSLSSVEDLAVYICGNRKMVLEVTNLIRQKGHCSIYREPYFDQIDKYPRNR